MRVSRKVLTICFMLAFVCSCSRSQRIVFKSSRSEIEITREKKVRLGWQDVEGENFGSYTEAVAHLSDNGIVIEILSDAGGKKTHSTRIVKLDELPVAIVEPWGTGKICIQKNE